VNALLSCKKPGRGTSLSLRPTPWPTPTCINDAVNEAALNQQKLILKLGAGGHHHHFDDSIASLNVCASGLRR
jgi:hypothetical protein